MSVAIGVDLGGTKIAAGVVTPDGSLVRSSRVPTPSVPEQILPEIAALVHEIADGEPIGSVGVGAAGLLRADRSTVAFAANLGWRDEPAGVRLAEALGVPVVVENDANAAAWAEFRFGAAADVDDFLMVTVGTGVGGGIVQGGRLIRGGFGAAAEIGHLRVVPDGLPCGCGQFGCLEQYASGSALVREAKARWGVDLTGPEVTDRAIAGDPEAIDLLADLGDWLGQGIASLVSVLDPALVVLGGGVAAAGDLLLKPTQAAFDAHVTSPGYRIVPPFALASLGNDAGIIGAADLARRDTDA